MARSTDWEAIPMALGADSPTWPLPGVTPKYATWSLGGGRPFGCALGACERWHAGVDLSGAPHGALVVAPEAGQVIGVDKGWTDGTRAIFFRTDSGLFLVLGGVIAGSHREFGVDVGQRLPAGAKLGRIVGAYGMLHFETYLADPTRTANSRWWKDDPVPTGLLNPINYIERMVGKNASLLQTHQRLEALRELGHYAGDVTAAWGDAATDALKEAQAALCIAVDGKWGPETEDAIQRALGDSSPCVAGTCSREPTDALSPMRIVGGVVAGLAVVGLTAAIVVTLRLRRPTEDAA